MRKYKFISTNKIGLGLMLLFLLSAKMWGQESNYFYDNDVTQVFYEHGYRIEHINNSDLFGGDVDQVYKDENGLLWVINVDKIKAFDGNQVKVYQADVDNRVHDSRDQFTRLLRDKKGNLWLNSTGAGFVHYDFQNQKYQRLFPEKDRKDNSNVLMDITEDEYGNKWMGYGAGILQVIEQDSMSINHIKMKSLGKQIQSKIEQLVADDKLISGITEVGNSKELSNTFTISEDSDVLLLGQGELAINNSYWANRYLDYGWLENDKGAIIWEMRPETSANAGGNFVNRLNVEVVNLKKGSYTIHYKTNSSYAYKSMQDNDAYPSYVPSVEEWWGLQIFNLTAKDKSEIDQILDNYEKNGGLSSFFTRLFKDSDGQIWTFGHSLSKLKINSDASYELEEVGNFSTENKANNWTTITGVYEKDKNHLWISTVRVDDNGQLVPTIGIFNKKTSKFDAIKTGIPSGEYDNMIQDENGNLWIGGMYAQGLFKLSPPFYSLEDNNEPDVKRFKILPDREIGKVKSLEIDDFHNLWVSTWLQGVYKISLNPLPFEYLSLEEDEALTKLKLGRIGNDSHGNIWINTYTPYRLVQVEAETNKLSLYDKAFHGIPFEQISFKTELPNGNLLFQTNDGLIEYDVSEEKAIKRAIPNQYTRRIHEKGFVLNDSLVYIFGSLININNWKVEVNFSEYLAGENRFAATKSADNRIWVQKQWGETAHFEWNGTNLDTLQMFLSIALPIDLLPGENDGLWMLNPLALKLMDNNSEPSKVFLENDLLKFPFAGNIFQCDSDMWIFTNNGIAKADLQTNAISRPSEVSELKIRSVTAGKDGAIIMLGSHKREIFFFHPDKVKIDTVPPKMLIESISYMDKDSLRANRSALSSAFGFAYDQNDVTLSYNAVQYNNPSGVNFSYQLENHQSDWQEVGKERTARFSNLPPGAYTFKVKASNAEGYWSKPETVSFTIHPPWWQTWWAYLVYALSIIGLLLYWYRSLQQKLKKEQAHNQELQTLNHELEDLNIANQRFVPNDFLKILGKKSIKDLKLGDQVATKMTVLFSDIRDYTPLSESMTPEENFKFINTYLGRVGPIIKEHGGFISSYLGDGLMALFVNEPQNAITATIAMQKELDNYNRERQAKGLRSLKTG